jgi:hypothetical protein
MAPHKTDRIARKATISTTISSNRPTPGQRLFKRKMASNRAENGYSKLPINGNLLRDISNKPDFSKKMQRAEARDAKQQSQMELWADEDANTEELAEEDDFDVESGEFEDQAYGDQAYGDQAYGEYDAYHEDEY